jgi:catechol 2,3-dioxygenase-like lactoylglutathione lyase family enzyme
MDMRIEVVVLPDSDVNRAKQFYVGLGCSIIFGTGVTDAAPGSADGLYLVVDDIEAAHSRRSASNSASSTKQLGPW